MLLINENRGHVITITIPIIWLDSRGARARETDERKKERNVQYCGNERIPPDRRISPQLVWIESHLDRHRSTTYSTLRQNTNRQVFEPLSLEIRKIRADEGGVRSAAII